MRARAILVCGTLVVALALAAAAKQNVQIVSGPQVQAIGPNAVAITWTTSAASSSTVKYGKSSADLAMQAQTPWGGTNHRVVIGNLTPGATYYYQVVSGQAQGSGTTADSGVASFQTPGANWQSGSPMQGGSTMKMVSGPNVQIMGPDAVTIYWTTDAAGTSEVKYGTDRNNLYMEAQSSGTGTQHQSVIGNLQKSQTYYYQIVNGQGTAATPISPVHHFDAPNGTNAAQGVQMVSGPTVSNVGAHAVTIRWATSAPGSASVRYGTDPNNLYMIAQAPWGGTEHHVEIGNLQPGATYYYQVISGQAKGTGTATMSKVETFVAPR